MRGNKAWRKRFVFGLDLPGLEPGWATLFMTTGAELSLLIDRIERSGATFTSTCQTLLASGQARPRFDGQARASGRTRYGLEPSIRV